MAVVPYNFAAAVGNVPASQLDANFAACQTDLGYTPINKAGDTNIGPLTMGSGAALTLAQNPTAALEATPKQYVDALGAPSILVSRTVASGTAGQGLTVLNTWTTIQVNTLDRNTVGGVLASNRVTIPAGSYFITAQISASIRASGTSFTVRAYNNTDSVALVRGTSGLASSTSVAISPLSGVFTIAGAKAVELQYFVDNVSAANTIGWQLSVLGESEVHVTWALYKYA